MDDVSQFCTYGKHKPTQAISAHRLKYLISGKSKVLRNIWFANDQKRKFVLEDKLPEI